MVRFDAALFWATVLGHGVAARIVHQIRYVNTTIISVAPVNPSPASPASSATESFVSSLLAPILPPDVGESTAQFSSTSARPAPTIYTSVASTSYPTSFTSGPSNKTSTYSFPTTDGPSVTTKAIDPQDTGAPGKDSDPDDPITTEDIPEDPLITDCLTLTIGEPVTVYEFVDNTTTITLPIGSNATSTPEFTPTPYCCTEDCNTLETASEYRKSKSSSTTLLPFFSFRKTTTTVIITSKNARTIFTAEDTPSYGDDVTAENTKKQTAGPGRTGDNVAPTFPAEKPFSTTPAPTTSTPTSGNGGGSSGESSGGSNGAGGNGGNDGGSSGGSSNSGTGSGSSGSGSSGSGSSGSDSSGGSSNGGGSSGGSSGGNSPGVGSSSGGSNGGSSGTDTSGESSSGSSSGGSSNSGSGSGSSGSSSSGGSSDGSSNSGSGSGSSGGGSTGGSSSSGQQASNGGTTSVNVGGVPIVLSPSNVVIDGTTYTPSNFASPTTVVANDQTFTINPSQVIAPGTVLNIPSRQGAIFIPSPTPTVIGGVTISIGGSVAWIGGSPYTFGEGAAPTTIVTQGKTISVGSAGLGFAKTTVEPPSALPTAVLILGGDVYSAIGSSVAVFDGQSITYGPGIDQTTTVFNGEALTIGPSGITQLTTTLGGPSRPTGTQIGIAGGLAVTEVGSSIVVIQSTTFTIGPGAETTTAIINGETITADPSVIEIGTITRISYPLNPTTRAVTAGGITLTEIGTSKVLIGSRTYTIGSGAPTTTEIINGETISIGPGGVGFRTTTVVPPTETAAGKKNGVGKVRPAFGPSIGLCIFAGAWFMT